MSNNVFSLFFNANGEIDFDPETLAARAIEFTKNQPGFFTPYRSGADFVETLTNPIVLPLSLGVVSAAFGVLGSIATVTALGSLTFGAVAGLVRNTELSDDCLGFALIAGIAALLTAAISVIAILFAAVTLVTSTAQLLTRTAATIVSPLVTCDDREEQQYDSHMAAF